VISAKRTFRVRAPVAARARPLTPLPSRAVEIEIDRHRVRLFRLVRDLHEAGNGLPSVEDALMRVALIADVAERLFALESSLAVVQPADPRTHDRPHRHRIVLRDLRALLARAGSHDGSMKYEDLVHATDSLLIDEYSRRLE